jgi:predicted lipoprotein with Yx(FWY)xxD motif
MKRSCLALTLFCGLVAVASAQTPPAAQGTTSKGPALVDHKKMTLYTYDKDAQGKSNCNGQCAANWPPLAAGSDAKATGKWSVITRDDGSKQWAYDGKPLYTFKKDNKPGDAVGDGVGGGTWHIAKP